MLSRPATGMMRMSVITGVAKVRALIRLSGRNRPTTVPPARSGVLKGSIVRVVRLIKANLDRFNR
jgi:hypothetical protein